MKGLKTEKVELEKTEIKLKKFYSKFTFELIVVIFISIVISGLLETLFKNLNFILPEIWIVDLFISLVFVFLVGFLGMKAYHRYKLSKSQYLILISTIVIFLVLRYNENNILYFQSINYGIFHGLKIADLFITLPVSVIFGGLFLKIIDTKLPKNNLSVYVSDEPFITSEISAQAIKVKELIIKGDYKESFSVGVIGAWGYGKSSFIEEVKTLFKKNNQVIEVHFSPYLNHNEDDVVGEFFNALKSQVQTYSGELSKSISHYAANITKAYKRGEIKDLLNPSFTISSESAYDLFKKVEDLILQLDRKIIIYIDDLDRLNAKEVIQVFKLIRNTSKFPRTFFIVSLDKNMVLKELSLNSPDSRRYIDKFFQLEINLPKIGSVKLREEFYRLINLISNKLPEARSLEKIVEVVNRASEFDDEKNKKCLFELYITNFRDVKKLYNQIANDISKLPYILDEFDTNDYINMTLLRLKFPEIYDRILHFPQEILTLKTYIQKKIYLNENEDEVEEEIENLSKPKSEKGKYYCFQGHNDLIFKEALSGDKKQIIQSASQNVDEKKIETFVSIRSEYQYTSKELELLKRTLEQVFRVSTPKNTRFIRIEEQLQAYLRIEFTLEKLKTSEFDKLLSNDVNTVEGNSYLKTLINQNKWGQIINHINQYEIKTKEETKKLVKLIIYSWQYGIELNLREGRKLEMLSYLLDENQRNTYHKNNSTMLSASEKVEILDEFVFENNQIGVENKIYLIHWIKNMELWSILWGYSNENLKEKGEKLFSEFLIYYIDLNKGWTSDGSTLIKNFDYLLGIIDRNRLLEILSDYLTNENIGYLLTEFIQPNIDETNQDNFIAFNYCLNNDLLKMFQNEETSEKFFNVLKEKITLPSFDEFIDFYRLQLRLNVFYIKFHFKNIYLPKIGYFTDSQINRANKSTQFIFEIDNEIRQFTPSLNDEKLIVLNVKVKNERQYSKFILFDILDDEQTNEELGNIVFDVLYKELKNWSNNVLFTKKPKKHIEIGTSIYLDEKQIITLIHMVK